MSAYLIIFGAAVRADGSPSGSLARRVEGALGFARTIRAPKFIPTGGLGKNGPTEAEVMRELLMSDGVRQEDIILEDRARNTLESAEYCHAILSARKDVEVIVPCTSRYHIPRCALLLRILGYKVRVPKMPMDRPYLPLAKWILYVTKEFIALPRDAVVLFFRYRFCSRRSPYR